MEEQASGNSYFMKRTDERLERIEDKLEQLISFRALLLGMSAVISTIVSWAIAYWRHGGG